MSPELFDENASLMPSARGDNSNGGQSLLEAGLARTAALGDKQQPAVITTDIELPGPVNLTEADLERQVAPHP